MGADLILAHAPFPVFNDGESVDNFGDILDQVVERYLFNWEVCLSVADMSLGMFDEDNAEILNALVAQAEEVVKICSGELYTRNTTDLNFDDRWYIFSGGLSWGDSPSESYQSISVVSDTNVFDRPFERSTDA